MISPPRCIVDDLDASRPTKRMCLHTAATSPDIAASDLIDSLMPLKSLALYKWAAEYNAALKPFVPVVTPIRASAPTPPKTRPVPVWPSRFSELTPKRTSTKQVIEKIPTTLSHTADHCTECGLFTWHKGIEPEYPKGYYCCRNVQLSSHGPLKVSIPDGCAPIEVIGPLGPLGVLSNRVSGVIRSTISEYGMNEVEVVIEGFSCFHEDISLKKSRIQGKYYPSDTAWRIVVCVRKTGTGSTFTTPNQNDDPRITPFSLSKPEPVRVFIPLPTTPITSLPR